MSTKTNNAPLFANYRTKNETINYADRLYVVDSQRSRDLLI